jgi:hypothetical protein
LRSFLFIAVISTARRSLAIGAQMSLSRKQMDASSSRP